MFVPKINSQLIVFI